MVNDNRRTGQTVDEQQGADVVVIKNRELLTRFAEMATAIPREDGGGTESILTQLLTASSWEDLNTPWETSDIEDILGKPLKLESATRRPSTLKGGLGEFLVLHMFDPRSGKNVVKSTGSISVIGAVAWLYFNDKMPVMIEWCRAERPSENGYYPQHLKILDSFAPAPADAASE